MTHQTLHFGRLKNIHSYLIYEAFMNHDVPNRMQHKIANRIREMNFGPLV